ncbi:MAG TPA: hypothetical protein VLA05_09425 [Coriobacteriia bacterium]|nr:hypothetical protein [Coriobacteriia bacterium]
MTEFAAIVYALVSVGAIGFQLALALGAPWGTYAMGGRFPGRFPPGMRIAAVVQAALIAVMAGVVLSRADLAIPSWSETSEWAIWVVVGFSSVSLVLNAMTPSRGERLIWVPVALVQVVSSLTVALTAT